MQSVPHAMQIVQDVDHAIVVMHGVCLWLRKQRKNLSKWWDPENMNRAFLLAHAEPHEFYAILMDGKPVASVILQDNERNQSWKYIDKGTPQKALYIHWLCVNRQFANKGLSKELVDFAQAQAREKGFKLLRLDTNADEKKLMDLYVKFGFRLMGVEEGDHGKIAYFQNEK